MTAAVINLSDLIDLAVGSQNSEDINFKVLQTALQAIIQHLNINDTKVEFRGADSENIQNIVKNIQDENLKKVKVNIVPEQTEAPKDVPTDDQSVMTSDSVGGKKRKAESAEDVVVVESGKVQEQTKKRLVTPSFLSRLEGKIKALQGQVEVLGSQVLPSDEVILQTTRSQHEAKPISELWQGLNITKRMSGAEEGIDKLASLLETVAKEYADLKTVIDKLEEELGQDMVETMKQIKLAANYAKQIRPREEIYQNKLSKKPKYEAKGVTKTHTVDQNVQKYDYADKTTKTVPYEESRGYLPYEESKGYLPYEESRGFMPSEESRSKIISERSEYGGIDRSGTKLTQGEMSRQQSSRPSVLLKRVHTASISESEVEPSEVSIFTAERPRGLKPEYTSQMDYASEEAVEAERDGVRESLTDRESFIRDQMRDSVQKVSLESQTLFDVIPPIPRGETVDREKINLLLAQHEYMKQNMEYLTAQINTLADFTENQLPEMIQLKKSKGKKEDGAPRATKDQVVGSRLQEVEGRLAKHSSKLKRQDVMLSEKTLDYDRRLSNLSATVSNLFETLNSSQNDDSQNNTIIEDLITKLQNIEDAVVEVGCSTQDLQDDKEQKTTMLQKIQNDLEIMRTAKADRYEIEDVLAEKADCYAVLEKVSQNVFDLACNDLAKGIDEALNRVSAQESLLAATMLELQNAIDNKFDREEVEPLKDEIMEKIEQLNKKFEKLSALKEGRLAAGAKKKYMTDVNCISCDRNVSMRIENDVPCIPAMADLPVMHSIAPYISYELDHLRKLKAKKPGPGCLIDFDDLAKRYNIKNLDSYENLVDVPQLQTRYCGGSHTKLGPTQRVTHIGHFNLAKNLKNK